MAYNYFPATYQYTPYAQPQIPQTQMQQPQIQQNFNPQSSIQWVRNSQEAAMYPVAPNNAVALWDSGSPVIYLKQADASGKPTMKTYDLVERTEMPQETQKSPEGSLSNFATKAELEALAGAVRGFDGALSTLREELDSLKAKKKPRKDEEDA